MSVLQILHGLASADLGLGESQAWLLAQLCKLFEAESSALFLSEQADGFYRIRTTVGTMAAQDSPIPPDSMTGLVADCIYSRQPQRIEKIATEGRFNPAVDAWAGIAVRSLMCAPLVWSGKTLGAIEMLNKQGAPFNAQDQSELSALAAVIARLMADIQGGQQLQAANIRLEIRRRELLRSRNTLRALFDSTPSSMYIVDREYVLAAVNMSCAGYVHKHPKELVGRRCYEALYQRAYPCPACRVGETFGSGRNTQRGECRQSNGASTDLEISTYPIHDEAGRVTQAILFEEDVTERRKLEASLIQSEKLAAVGHLAAGVAHEINNPLTAIIANAQLLQRSLPDQDAEFQEMVAMIVQAGERASQVVRDLLDFARREHFELVPTDVNETIRRAISLVQHELSARSIRLEVNLADDLPPITASRDQLQGVWINLLVNAIDAVDGEQGEIHITSYRAGDELRVMVADNGGGISAEQLPHIFEPFYTTKGPGHGTGLGLSVCQRVITQHGGNILVESRPRKGMKFIVKLPVFVVT